MRIAAIIIGLAIVAFTLWSIDRDVDDFCGADRACHVGMEAPQ